MEISRASHPPEKITGAVAASSRLLNHAQESQDTAERKANAIIADLRAGKMSKAADIIEQTVQETLTYYAFPVIHWHKIRTNNPLERIMRGMRRRTRVVGAFPDGQSCLNLAAARLRYIARSA
jgi:putative transposase